LKRAGWFFDDHKPFLVHNVDVLTDLDYTRLLKMREEKDALAVLAVRERDTSRYFLFDKQNRLCGWKNVKTGEQIIKSNSTDMLTPLSFMGIQVLSPEIFAHFPRESKFSLVDAYLGIAAKNLPVYGLDCGDTRWMDVGKPEALEQAEEFISGLGI
jgi:NDP-sugar pyrophosphorylase family protein